MNFVQVGGHPNEWILVEASSDAKLNGCVVKRSSIRETTFYLWLHLNGKVDINEILVENDFVANLDCENQHFVNSAYFPPKWTLTHSQSLSKLNFVQVDDGAKDEFRNSNRRSIATMPPKKICDSDRSTLNADFQLSLVGDRSVQLPARTSSILSNPTVTLSTSDLPEIDALKPPLSYKTQRHQELISQLKKLTPALFDLRPCTMPDCQQDAGGRYEITMENLLKGMHWPCVMDIKMGTQLHGEDSSFSKKLRQIKSAKNCTAHSLGLRLSGVKGRHSHTGKYFEIPRDFGRCLKARSGLIEAVLAYVSLVPRRISLALCCKFICQLFNIIDWFDSQNMCSFYGSSLMFAYDSFVAGDASRDKISLGYETDDFPDTVLKMIDFAHVNFYESEKMFMEHRDEGFILGLRNLVHLFQEVLEHLSSCPVILPILSLRSPKSYPLFHPTPPIIVSETSCPVLDISTGDQFRAHAWSSPW